MSSQTDGAGTLHSFLQPEKSAYRRCNGVTPSNRTTKTPTKMIVGSKVATNATMIFMWSLAAFAMMMVAVIPPGVKGFVAPGLRKMSSPFGILYAGGFEWTDPTKIMDQGVENPFKNPNLMNGEDGLKIDPARLLGPRLNGANIYFIGMMGCGKTSIGDTVARRKCNNVPIKETSWFQLPALTVSVWLSGMGSYSFLDTDQIIEKVR